MLNTDLDGPPEELRGFASEHFGGGQEWVALSGGRSNRSWRLRVGPHDFVFKLFDLGRSNPLFPNDPKAEIAAMKHLSGTGIAPEFHAAFPTQLGLCLVYQYLPGAPIGKTDAAAIRALGRLHRQPSPTGLRQLAISPSHLLQEGHRFMAALPSDRAEHLLKLKPVAIDIPPGPKVFLHGDPVPANVLPDGEARRFIDWQCPAYGDATFDLAVALSPGMHVVYGRRILTREASEAALLAYPDATTTDRYRALQPFYRWHMATYCAWKAAQGEEIYAKALEAELSQLAT